MFYQLSSMVWFAYILVLHQYSYLYKLYGKNSKIFYTKTIVCTDGQSLIVQFLTFEYRLKVFGFFLFNAICVMNDLNLLYKIITKKVDIPFRPFLAHTKLLDFYFNLQFHSCLFHSSIFLWNKFIISQLTHYFAYFLS